MSSGPTYSPFTKAQKEEATRAIDANKAKAAEIFGNNPGLSKVAKKYFDNQLDSVEGRSGGKTKRKKHNKKSRKHNKKSRKHNKKSRKPKSSIKSTI